MMKAWDVFHFRHGEREKERERERERKRDGTKAIPELPIWIDWMEC